MRIASVEDDAAQADQIRQLLDEAGFSCTSFATGAAFLRALRDQAFDLILMDWQLPDTSGYELVSWVRQHSGRLPPILFLTSRIDEADIVAGLSVGADDYLAKPVRPAEFVARVRALLRRAYPDAVHDDELIRQGSYVVDARRRNIAVAGQVADLSPREFHLMLELAREPGVVVAKGALAQRLEPLGDALDFGAIEVHVSNLRRKIGAQRIGTVRGVGYLLLA